MYGDLCTQLALDTNITSVQSSHYAYSAAQAPSRNQAGVAAVSSALVIMDAKVVGVARHGKRHDALEGDGRVSKVI
jgi:hypothetical protein